MEVKTAIEKRRAYRSLQKAKITDDLIKTLGKAASLSPSCFNNQPWKFVFVYNEEILEKMVSALSSGNQSWAKNASMIIAVLGKKEDDCVIKGEKGERAYYLFDIGQSVAFLILQAVDLGYVAHPIAGYNPNLVREILSIPSSYKVVNLIIIGKKNPNNDNLSEKQRKSELERPTRHPLDDFVFHNKFTES